MVQHRIKPHPTHASAVRDLIEVFITCYIHVFAYTTSIYKTTCTKKSLQIFLARSRALSFLFILILFHSVLGFVLICIRLDPLHNFPRLWIHFWLAPLFQQHPLSPSSISSLSFVRCCLTFTFRVQCLYNKKSAHEFDESPNSQ